MLCDHANFLVIRRGVFAPYPAADGSILIPADAPAGVLLVQRVYGIFEILGHIGFPIFIFLLTEGFLHTRSRKRYLLTLAAIAKEIAYRNAPTTTPVILAAGLPLTSFGREKKAFRAYLLREGKPVSFSYEGISYETSVQDVKLFPQGYAAILQHSDLLNEPSVILADIGGWTTTSRMQPPAAAWSWA